MKANHHVVRKDGLNPFGTDHVVNETDDALDWFPELKDCKKLIENLQLKKITLDVDLDKQEGLSTDIVRIYFEIFMKNDEDEIMMNGMEDESIDAKY